MRRLIIVGVAAALVASSAASRAGSFSDDWHQFWGNVKRDFHRNNCWPDPFVYPDRASVISPLQLQVAHGWRMTNLVGEYYFDPKTHELTAVGRDRVRWILTQTPTQYRTVFVQRGISPDQTATRVDSIQRFAAEVVPQGELPNVVDTHLQPRGWPADYINTVYGQFEKTTPSPRLPQASSTGGLAN